MSLLPTKRNPENSLEINTTIRLDKKLLVKFLVKIFKKNDKLS